MKGMNMVILLGNLGADPMIYRKTDEDTGEINVMAKFNLATDEKYYDNNRQLVTNTEWHRLVCFGQMAVNVEKYVLKGSRLQITGKLRTREYKDKEGVKRWVTEIVIVDMILEGSPKEKSEGTETKETPIKEVPEIKEGTEEPDETIKNTDKNTKTEQNDENIEGYFGTPTLVAGHNNDGVWDGDKTGEKEETPKTNKRKK